MKIEISAQMRCDGCGHINSDLHKGRNQCRECGDIFMWSPKLRAPALKRPLRESDIEAYLVKCAKAAGGEVRKVQWIGRSGAPDRLVMLPYLVDKDGYMVLPKTIWIELKAPGKKAEPHQLREHERMRKMGQRVEVIDSYEGVEALFK